MECGVSVLVVPIANGAFRFEIQYPIPNLAIPQSQSNPTIAIPSDHYLLLVFHLVLFLTLVPWVLCHANSTNIAALQWHSPVATLDPFSFAACHAVLLCSPLYIQASHPGIHARAISDSFHFISSDRIASHFISSYLISSHLISCRRFVGSRLLLRLHPKDLDGLQ